MKIVPSVHGVHWLRGGWQLFIRNPLIWILCFAAQIMIIVLLGQLPFIGSVLVMLTGPAFSAGFLCLGEAAEKNQPLAPALLFAGFRMKPGPLLALGGLYLIGGALSLLLSSFLLGTPPPSGAAPTALASADMAGLAFWLVLVILLYMSFWFAPALVLWHDMAPLKAAFFSFFACLRNWRAFALYTLVILVFVTAAMLLFALLGALLPGPQAPAETAGQNFLLIFILGLMPMLLASVYVSYRDVFAAT